MGMEMILDQFNQSFSNVTGNISQFNQLMRTCYYLAANGQPNIAYYKLMKYISISLTQKSVLMNSYMIKRDIDFSEIQFNETQIENTETVFPFMVYDLLFIMNDIALFNQAVQNLENLIGDPRILEIQLGHIFHDQQDIVLKQLNAIYYDDYMHTMKNDISNITLQRFKLFNSILDQFQMHYFTYSSGSNWKDIMKEQLKAQPYGQTQKYRIGQINGNIAITKALLVTNKNLDNQTGVNGFLTIVLNKTFDLGINGQYSLLDGNFRYIGGIQDSIYLEGIRQLLVNYKYLQQIRINNSINEYYYVYELNYVFWENALTRADNNEFTMIVQSEKNTFLNYLNIEDYTESEMHTRTIIFNASSPYFYSGKIVVKQFGALDGILIMYENVTLNSQESISAYQKQFEKQYDEVTNINKIDQSYNNLTSRDIKTTQIIRISNICNRTIVSFTQLEINQIVYIFSIPLIVLILLQLQQFRLNGTYYNEIDIVNISRNYSDINLLNEIDKLDYHQQNNTFYIVPQTRKFKCLTFNAYRRVLFAADQKYYNNYIDFQHNLLQSIVFQPETELNEISFQIFTSSQQYALMINQLKKCASYLQNTFVNLSGSLTFKYNITAHSYKRPRLATYKAENINGSVVSSRIPSRLPSKLPSLINSFTLSFKDNDEYYQMCFDDSGLFYQKRFSSPFGTQILKFSRQKITLSIDELVNSAIE
ncbi:Conserved_hypothetical protein [Hexamita inflata]|uniref:Uncharacterized protein n=1 Tax=Hexamita inflata TaxID=28002 RepID=A0AA86UBA5_9EUKA|nr:Conserved hypothetical protein [Hexamita inflata]CAI9963412.1 Conserved hypothetical protein [Hexamita inflata]